MKIIIVEDTVKIREELSTFLKRYGYEVHAITEFERAVEDILEQQGDLLLLDINLPVFDGFYICREIRAKSELPIIVVTSRDSEMDELMSMNLGADDFVTKPYNTQILLARIQALLKRARGNGSAAKSAYAGISLDGGKFLVSYGEKTEVLSKNEYRILDSLIELQGEIVSRDELMDELWQNNEFIDDNTLTVNINRIRKKLENIGVDNYVVTKRGVGYYLNGDWK